MKYGHLEGTNYYNALGKLERQEFKLIGPPVVSLSLHALYDFCGFDGKEFPKIINLCPYKLRYIGNDWDDGFTQGFVYAIENNWLWRFYYLLFQITPCLRVFKSRLIITLAVWNWADWSEGRIPSFKDIRPPWKKKTLI